MRCHSICCVLCALLAMSVADAEDWTQWRGPHRAEGKGGTSLIYADGHVIFRREDGTIILAKATPEKFDVVGTFKPAFQERESWSHPVIAGGKLYLREQNKLMCYGLK